MMMIVIDGDDDGDDNDDFDYDNWWRGWWWLMIDGDNDWWWHLCCDTFVCSCCFEIICINDRTVISLFHVVCIPICHDNLYAKSCTFVKKIWTCMSDWLNK